MIVAMTKTIRLIMSLLTALLSTMLIAGVSQAADTSQSGTDVDNGVVNTIVDNEGDFTPSEVRTLSDHILSLKDRADVVVAIVTTDSFNGMEGREYAVRWGNAKGLGDGSKNNGIVVAISMGDRKTGIAYGTGVTWMNESNSSYIVQNMMLPELRANNPGDAADAALVGILRAHTGELDKAIQQDNEANVAVFKIVSVVVAVLLGIIVLALVVRSRIRARVERDLTPAQAKSVRGLSPVKQREFFQNNGIDMNPLFFYLYLNVLNNSNYGDPTPRYNSYSSGNSSSSSSSNFNSSSFGGGSFDGGGASGSW